MPDSSLFGDEHVRQHEATNGQIGHAWNDTPILILRTKGRATGELRNDKYRSSTSRGIPLVIPTKR